jgi:hypothetical protein
MQATSRKYKIMKMKMFALLVKAKPDIESIRGGGQAYDRSSD